MALHSCLTCAESWHGGFVTGPCAWSGCPLAQHTNPAHPHDPVARATRHRGALPPGSAPVALSSNPNHASPFVVLSTVRNFVAGFVPQRDISGGHG